MKPSVFFRALMVSALMSACAQGPKFSVVKSALPKVSATEGRIYFYRLPSLAMAAVQPSIILNEQVVGDSTPGGFFFVDKAPGEMSVATSTEVEKKLAFTLEAGETRYVRTTAGVGLLISRVHPEIVDNETGERELAETSYTGRAAARDH